MLDSAGEVLATARMPEGTVVAHLPFRVPNLYQDWPYQGRPEDVTRRIAASRWYYQEHLLKDVPSHIERWERMSEDERERRVLAYTLDGRLPFAGTRPEITAAYGAGSCLWIGGFRAADFILGAGLEWVGVNVRTEALAGVVRYSTPGRPRP